MRDTPPLLQLDDSNEFQPFLDSRLGKAVRAALFGTAIGLAGVPLAALAQPASSVSQQYAIGPGSLDEVLNQFARQAGITLSSTPQMTQGAQSPGLQGSYATDQALRSTQRADATCRIARDLAWQWVASKWPRLLPSAAGMKLPARLSRLPFGVSSRKNPSP